MIPGGWVIIFGATVVGFVLAIIDHFVDPDGDGLWAEFKRGYDEAD